MPHLPIVVQYVFVKRNIIGALSSLAEIVEETSFRESSKVCKDAGSLKCSATQHKY